jgi:hypothetical protein
MDSTFADAAKIIKLKKNNKQPQQQVPFTAIVAGATRFTNPVINNGIRISHIAAALTAAPCRRSAIDNLIP